MFPVNAFLNLKKQEVGSFKGFNEDHYVYPLVRFTALSGNKTDTKSEFWLQIKYQGIKNIVLFNYTLGIENKARDSIWPSVLHQAREGTEHD